MVEEAAGTFPVPTDGSGGVGVVIGGGVTVGKGVSVTLVVGAVGDTSVIFGRAVGVESACESSDADGLSPCSSSFLSSSVPIRFFIRVTVWFCSPAGPIASLR